MPRYSTNPWRSQDDLLSVREQIYSTSQDDRQRAVNRIMAWKLRGNLPHAVESTALLVDAILHHSNSSANSIFSIRAVYSAAFTRFVTGFCDIGRNKERSLEPSSMLDIAKQIGMPTEFVALRHEATHEELPAIQRLVKATEDALAWLWNVHWSGLEELETEQSVAKMLPEVKAQVREIFKVYRSSRRETLKSKKPKDQTEETRATSRALSGLMDGSRLRMQAVADVLVEDKLLIPSKRDLGAPLDGAYLIWDGLLRDIINSSKAFLMAVTGSILKVLTQRNGDDARTNSTYEALSKWCLHMQDYAVSLKQQSIYRSEIMAACCMHTGYWPRFLARHLFDIGSLEFRATWREFIEEGDELTVDGASADVGMQDFSVAADVARTVENISCNLDRWFRAATPIDLPIGMIR